MKVGQLAKELSLSVRTLHHYDQIGLISPNERGNSGHRIYSKEDIESLRNVILLKNLGFSLSEIKDLLKSNKYSTLELLNSHVKALRIELSEKSTLLSRLENISNKLRMKNKFDINEAISITKEVVMLEKYFTPEQQEELKKRGESLGQESIERAQNCWPELISKVRKEMELGTDPKSEKVKVLAGQWMDLVNQFTGGNPDMEKSLSNMYDQEPDVGKQCGLDKEIFDYISEAAK